VCLSFHGLRPKIALPINRSTLSSRCRVQIRTFTALRGVACIIVVWANIWSLFNLSGFFEENNLSSGSWQVIFYNVMRVSLNKSAALEIFLVLSGCTLSISLMKSDIRYDWLWVQRFYIKRLFRIYPTLWVSIFITVCLWPVIRAGMSSPAYSWSAVFAFPPEITPKLIALSLISAHTHLNGPIWSMRIQILYSLLFPGIFLLIRQKKSRFPLLMVTLFLAIAPIGEDLPVHYALAFVLGAVIPFSNASPTIRYRMFAIIAFIALLYTRAFLEYCGVGLKGVETAESIISFALVYCIYHNKKPIPLLDLRMGEYLGKMSYSVYILHYPVLFAAATCAVRILSSEKIQAQPIPFVLCFGMVSLGIIVAASALSYSLIEKTGEHLGKMLLATHYTKIAEAAKLSE
jgi:peptidoglycan/LPS O-acetylase OafA/YrhL